MGAATGAARERVEAIFAATDRLSDADLRSMSAPRRDLEHREALVTDVVRLGAKHGRTALLEEAWARLDDGLNERLVSRIHLEGVPLLPASGRADDQALVLLALSDAVGAAIVEDLMDPADAAELANPGRRLLGMKRLPQSPAVVDEPVGGWAPSDRDWAAAARGSDVERGRPMPGVRRMWLAFLVVAGACGVIFGLAWGVAEGQPLFGALAAGATVAVAWTLATFRSAGRPR